MDINKTLYTFLDVYGNISTLTLNKYVALSVQSKHGDVHQWVQSTYDLFAKQATKVSRRTIGDLIRQRAQEIHWANPQTFADL